MDLEHDWDDRIPAAQHFGITGPSVLLRHIFPNLTAPLIVQASIGVAVAIIAEAGLSFLGLELQPPTTS